MDNGKKLRLELLGEIDKWEKKRCAECNSGKPNKKLVMCKCEAATKIREVGKKLDAMGSPAKFRRIEALKKRAVNNFDVAVYIEMKDNEMTDKEIYTAIGWTRKGFFNWKRDRDFIQKFRKGHRIGQNKKEGATN